MPEPIGLISIALFALGAYMVIKKTTKREWGENP